MTRDEIREKWDYPNADKLDWNDAKNTVDFLLSENERLENLWSCQITFGREQLDYANQIIKECHARIKELEEGIEKHKIETWKLVNKINHPIIDADIELWKFSEKDFPCPKCGEDVGHLINCPDGSAFSGDRKSIKNNPLEGEMIREEALKRLSELSCAYQHIRMTECPHCTKEVESMVKVLMEVKGEGDKDG